MTSTPALDLRYQEPGALFLDMILNNSGGGLDLRH